MAEIRIRAAGLADLQPQAWRLWRRPYASLGGFDPQFAHESPGTLLIAHAIPAATAEGRGEFHFLRGRERRKCEWRAVGRWSMRRVLSRQGAHA